MSQPAHEAAPGGAPPGGGAGRAGDRPDDPVVERRRETDPLRVVPALDGMRGYALLMVIAYHCWIAAFSSELDGGPGRDFVASFFIAVDMFFVISGFVLFLPTARDGSFGSVRDYFGRRVARIAPAYYLSIAGFVLLWPAISAPGSGSFWQRDQIETLGVHLVFLQRELLSADVPALYGFGTQIGFGYNGPLWSLSIEILYYLMLPAIALLYLRRPVAGLVAALAVSVLWRAGAWELAPRLLPEEWSDQRRNNAVIGLAYQYPALLFHLCLGMTAAWVYVRMMRAGAASLMGRVRARAAPLQLLAGLAFVGSLILSGHRDNAGIRDGWYFHYARDVLPTALFAALVLFTAMSAPRAQVVFTNRVMRWMGDVSYGAYLWHAMVVWIALWHLDWFPTGPQMAQDPWPFFRNFLLVTPVALLLGWMSWEFVEQPAIRWMRRRQRRRRQRAAAGAAAAGASAAP